jgi:tryptophan-rich sensory protein
MTPFPEQATLPPARQALGLVAWLALCVLTAFIGAVASVEAPSFYGQLTQPDWAPPAWLFGPVWTTLYMMMAAAAWLVWRRGGFGARRMPLILFLLQLALNGLWSWLFFAWQMGGAAFADILVLCVLIAATITAFWRVSRLAALLLVPYLGWVSFAAVLNFTVWRLNPGLL